ncbi:MAG TPA: SdrD B-like domain-containing protein, partial [Saprospiraceae bacterium]|nr:SdrD B-like domain-containing protein [Saprospiraceae bacterium]
MNFFSKRIQGRIPTPLYKTVKHKLKFLIRTFSFLASGLVLAYSGWKWYDQNQPLALMAGGPSGSVFRDYNGDGVKQSGEPLVPGVTVNAYDASGALCATTVSNFSNTAPNYTLPMGCSGQIRIEFVIGSLDDCLDPGIDFTALNGAAYGSSVQFVDASTMTPVNFGLYNPADYNRGATNSKVFIPCYTTGDPLVVGTSRSGAWFLGYPYNNSGTVAKSNMVTGETIGSTWGVAYSDQAKVVFSAAFLKRHVGLGTLGSGGIYKLVPTPTSFTATSFYDMDANGHRTRAAAGCVAYGNGSSFTINAAPGTEVTYNGVVDPLTGLACGLGVIGTNAQRGLLGDKTAKSHDPAAFDQVGKVGLGDMEISDDGLFLFVTNLYSRRIFRLELNDAYNPTAIVAVDSFNLPSPSPSVTNGVLRPFATKYHRGKLFVGALSTGENGGVNTVGGATDMNAYVFELDNANTAPSLTAMSQTLTYPLNYLKGPSRRDMTGVNRGEKWNPWTRNNDVSLSTNAANEYRTYPTPMLTDIEFNERGDLIMAYTDRSGHQWGWINDRHFTGTVLIRYIVGGDILIAGVNCNTGAYTLESNGSFNSTSIGFTTNTVVSAPNVNGVGNMDGPGGGEFFDQEFYNPYHDETAQGSMAVLPGDNKIITTIMDPLGIFEGGTIKFSTLNGDESHRYRLFENATGNFGKANGLGDLELDGLIPPLEIGNRVWFDTDMDGVQDPGEAPIANVTVELYDGVTLIGTDVTDVNGNYYFDTLNVADGNQSIGGNQKGPQPNRTYTIRIGSADWTGGAGTGDLTGYVLTMDNVGGAGQPDVRDNDGVLSSMIPTISYTTGAPGQNDHTLDFGFILADEPIVDLALRKTIDTILQDGTNPTALNNGDTVKFKIQLFNQGELGMDSLNVTDYLPAGFKFVNATGTGQVNEGWDGTDPNNPVYKWRSNTGSGGGGSLTTAQTLPLTAQTGDGVNSLSFMHNPGTGSNRLLVLGIAVGNDDGTGEPPTVTTAQFQSVNLDFVGTVQSPGAGGSNENDVRIYIYKQNNPTGSGNIDISISGTGDISAQAVTFNGVDLSNPLGAFQNTSGLTSPVSNMFSASSGQVVFSMLGVDGGTSITSTGGQTVIFNGSNDQVSGAAVYENGPNPTTTFTLGGDQDWALGAVPINVYSQPPFNPGDTLEICIYTTLEHVPGSPTAADFTNFAEISFARDTNGVDQSANDIDSPLNNNPNDNAGGQQGSPADDYINGDGSGTPGDGVAPTDQDNHDPAFLNIFDLALKKTIDTGSISGNGLYTIGTDITFNITVTNQGTDTAQNIEITDYLPCGLSFSLAPPNPGWTRTGSLATYTAPGPLAPGQSLIVPIILQISPSDSCNPDPLDYINVAEISGAEDDEGNTYTSDVDSDYDQIKNNDAGGNVNSPSDDVITGDGTGTPNDEVADTDEDDQDPAELLVFDLALRKIVSPATPGYPGPYNINDLIRFDITIFNQGNIDADTVSIVDNLPAGLSFTAGDNTGLNWVAGPGANQVQRTLNMVGGDTLNAGEDTTVSIFLRVLHTSGGIGAYTNISEITSATAIIDGLNVTMSGDADSPYDANANNDAGGQVTSPADNEILGNGTGSPGDGIASGDEDDQDPALVTIVDVALKKLISASTPGPYQYGDNVQFEITVTNQGTIALDSMEVTDYIPSGFTFGANPDWTLSGSDAMRVIRSRLDPSEDTLITINLVIAAESDLSKVDSAWINYAEVSQAFDTLGTDVSLLDIDSDLDNNPGNNAGGRPLSDADNYIDGDGTGVIGDGVDTTDQDNHDPALVSVVDVALRKIAADTLGDASLAFGDTIRFDIQIFNQGNVVIDSLTITDYIPEGFAYLPLFNPGWSGSYPSPQYGWGTSDDLLPGESDTISIYLQIVSVGEPNLAKYTNYAEISFASDTLGVNQSSNDSDSPLNTLDDDNAGGQPLSPADDYIDGNGSGAIGDGVDSTDQDNHDPASVYPRVVDVALVKRIGFTTPGPFTLGDTVVFDLKIVNQGTITLDSVYLVDYIPAGFAFDAVLNPVWTLLGNQASTIVDETLLPGQSTIVSISLIILKITDLSLVDSAWTNRAEITRIFDEDGNDVSSEDADSPLDNDPDNNPGGQPGSSADDEENGDGTGSPGDGVPGTDQDNADPAFVDLPDLALRKIIQDTLGDGSLNYGDTIKFGIQLFNQGNIPVDSIRIEDSIPSGYSFVPGSLNAGWILAGQDASYDWGQGDTLFPGEIDTICIYLTLNMVTPSAAGHWINRAEITYFADTTGTPLVDIDSNPDNEQTNDPGGSPDTPSDDAIDGDGTGMPGDTSRTTDEDDEDPAGLKFYDLALVKQVAAGSTVTAYGDSVKFLLTIINQGTEPVDSILITDTLPAGLMFDNSLPVNNIWTPVGNELTTMLRTRLDPGEDTVICLALKVLKNYDLSVAGSTWVNRAEISSAFDTLGMDIDDRDIDSPLDENYGNNGGGQPESPADDETGGNGTGPVGGPDSGTDQDNADPALVEVADLALRKVAMDTLGDNVLLFGDTVKIAIQIFNQGSIPVDSIVITDSLPAGLGFVTGPLNAGWVFNGSDYEYGWGTGDTLYPGESDTVCIYVIFQLGFPGTPETYTNLAEISEFFDTDGNPLDDVDSAPDDNQANDGGGEPKTGSDDPIDGDGTGMPGDTSSVTDEDDEDPLELGFFDLALRKVVNAGSTATAYGDTVKFDLMIFNQGSIPTDSIILTDSLPAGFSFDATIPGNAGWVQSGNKLTKAVSGLLLTGLEDTTVCLWLTVEQVLNPADHATAWINYAEISEAWLAGNNISILDIDSELNNIYGDNAGGQPDSPADDEVDGDGTGAIGDGVDTTDQDNADPARVEIVDLALRKIIMDTLGDATLEYGDTIKFAIHLFNQGNVPIDSLVVNDTLPNGFSYVNDPGLNAGWVFAGTEANYGWGTGGTLFPGESDTICLYLRLEMVTSGLPDFTNRAEISYAQDTTGADRSNDDIDSPLNDNYGDNAGGQPGSPADNEVDGVGTGMIGAGVDTTDQDNADPAFVEVVDLALRKIIVDTLGDATLEYGDTVKFAIHLFNQGNVAIDSLMVNDTLPSGFSFVNDPGLNAGWTNPLGNETSYFWGESDTLNPGESDTICIYLRLEQVNTGVPDFTNRAEISYAEDLTGADRSNDDIDSPLNDQYWDNAGGQPESPADNEVDGDGTGALGDGVAPTDQDNADPALVQVVDLALRKVILDTLGDATLEYGDTIKFAIHLFNQGNVPVEELTVTDTLPNGFSFVDNSLNTGWSLPAGNETQFVWGAGDTLNPGESDTLCIYLRLEMILSGIPDFVNRAEISSATGFGETDLSDSDIDSPLNGNYGDNAGGQPDSPADDEVEGIGTGAIGDGVDSTDQDNADPARVEVLDLALRKLLVPGPRMTVVYADTAEFIIEVINQGNVPATNIKITDSLPDGFVADAGVNPGWTTVNSTSAYSTYCYTLTDTLHPGDTASLNFYGIVESSEMQGAWINYAEITSVQDTTGADRSGDDIDSSPDGNVGGNDGGGQPESEADDETNGDGTGAIGDGVASTDEDDEDPAALMLFNLALKKEIDGSTPGPYRYGDTVRFVVTVVNQGNIPATNIEVSDSIPAGFAFDAGLNPDWTGPGPVVTLVFTDTIAMGDTTTALLDLIVQPVVDPMLRQNAWTNLAEISYAEDTSGNNTDTNLPDHDSYPDDDFTNDAGGRPESPADNYLNGNGQGQPGDGVAETDEDDADPALVEVFDLALVKQIDSAGTPLPYTYGDLIKYKLRVINQGNEPAVNIEVADYIPQGLVFDGPSNPEWSLIDDSTAVTTIADTLFADEDTVLCIYLRLQPAADRNAWVNVAEISYAEDSTGADRSNDDADHVLDRDRTNNAGSQVNSPADDYVDGDGTGSAGDGIPGTDGDNIDPAWLDVFDLALIKTTPHLVVQEGEVVDFYITVYNQGNIDAENIKVTDYIPLDMSLAASPGWTVLPPDSACYTIPGPLFVGDSITIQINLQVDDPAVNLPEGLYNYAEISSATDTMDADYPDIDGDFDADPGNDPGGDLFNDDDNNISGNGKRGEDEDNHDGAYVMVCKGYVCNDRVNVSFGDLCEIIVTGDDVIENPMLPSIHYRVTLRDASGKIVPDARLTRAHMGYCFTYSVDAPACPANSCWGTICVEDKAPPMIDCSADTVLCFELSNLPSEGMV